MLTVDHYARIRQLRRDGLTIRQIADQLQHSPKTILKALAHPEPPPVVSSQPRAAPVFGPFRPLVDAILDADASAPRKQRHTASQVFRRLRDERGYGGGYDQVTSSTGTGRRPSGKSAWMWPKSASARWPGGWSRGMKVSRRSRRRACT